MWTQDKPLRLIDTVATEGTQYPMDLITNIFPQTLLSRINASVYVKLSHNQSSKRKNRVSASELAHLWNIGLMTAERTLQATTQLAIRNAIHPIQ
jgi:hypothetical protein